MKNTRNLVLVEDVYRTGVDTGRALADVPPRLFLSVPPSGQSGIDVLGGKCFHGVYIPATSPWKDHAPDCSICRPYEILVKKNGIFKA
jgi:hypothetical protein